jgi:hypothetical protein
MKKAEDRKSHDTVPFLRRVQGVYGEKIGAGKTGKTTESYRETWNEKRTRHMGKRRDMFIV